MQAVNYTPALSRRCTAPPSMAGMTNYKSEFGERLREARTARGISRAVLAEQLSIKEGLVEPSGQQRIANYELGYNEPNLTVLRILASILEVSIDWLSGQEPGGLDTRFEKIRQIYHQTDERGRRGIFGYANTQPVKPDRDNNNEPEADAC